MLDPELISDLDLFLVLWQPLDLTQHTSQGNDVGTQHCSGIYDT